MIILSHKAQNSETAHDRRPIKLQTIDYYIDRSHTSGLTTFSIEKFLYHENMSKHVEIYARFSKIKIFIIVITVMLILLI